LSNIKQRLENALAEIEIIREALKFEGMKYPPCCITVDKDSNFSCATAGPMSEEEFLKGCEYCIGIAKLYLSYIKEVQIILHGIKKE